MDIEESLSAVGPAVQNLEVDSGKVNYNLYEFISVKVEELSKIKGYKSGLKEKIIYALTEKAGRIFLYVLLVLHDLRKIRISSQVVQKLKELPLDLYKLYDRILGLIDADCEEVAKMVFGWVAVARRPLTVDELAMVLALGTGEQEKDIRPLKALLDEMEDAFKCCEPLVSLDTRSRTINLVY